MHLSRRTLLVTLVALPPASLAVAVTKTKKKAPKKEEPHEPALSREELADRVKAVVVWANTEVYTAKLARENIVLQKRIDAREPAGSEGEAPYQIKKEQERLDNVEMTLKEKRKALRELATTDAQRLRIDEWYIAVKTALYDGSSAAQRTMGVESERMQLAFEDD
ncbi:MAG: hypothetical protein JSR92_09285 [Proteobacteria bacterium]|nr:hypothetical protein [Pseudomonadota bacterium]